MNLRTRGSLGGPWGLAVTFAAAAVGCRGAL